MPSHAIAHFMAFFCCCFFFVYTESATPESRVQAIHCLVHKLPERNRLVLSLVTKHLAKWVETAFSLSFYLYTQFFVCTFSVSFLQPFYFSRPSATIFYHYFQLSPSFHSYRQYTNTHLPTGSTLRNVCRLPQLLSNRANRQTALWREERKLHMDFHTLPCCYLDRNFFLEKTSPAPLLSIQQLPTLRRELCNSFL